MLPFPIRLSSGRAGTGGHIPRVQHRASPERPAGRSLRKEHWGLPGAAGPVLLRGALRTPWRSLGSGKSQASGLLRCPAPEWMPWIEEPKTQLPRVPAGLDPQPFCSRAKGPPGCVGAMMVGAQAEEPSPPRPLGPRPPLPHQAHPCALPGSRESYVRPSGCAPGLPTEL